MKINYRGEYTNTTGGLWLAQQVLDSPQYGGRGAQVPRLIILITDGVPNVDVNTLQAQVNSIKAEGNIRLITIGVTDQVRTWGVPRMSDEW